VRVNAIAPGLVRTELARGLWENNETEITSRIPLRRLGEPEDIAQMALVLVSDASSWGDRPDDCHRRWTTNQPTGELARAVKPVRHGGILPLAVRGST